jgi:hypothetical protein
VLVEHEKSPVVEPSEPIPAPSDPFDQHPHAFHAGLYRWEIFPVACVVTGYLLATGHHTEWWRPGGGVVGTLVLSDERGVVHEIACASELRAHAWDLLDRLVELRVERGIAVEIRVVPS